MSNRVSEQGSDGACNFCRNPMNLDPALGTGPRGGIYTPNPGPPVRLCTYCAADPNIIGNLYAGALLDSTLDPGTTLAALASTLSGLLGLPE